MNKNINPKIIHHYDHSHKVFSLWKIKRRFSFDNQPILLFLSLTWVPLLILSMLSGVAFSGVRIPFIFDIEVHVRFLLVLSILIFMDKIIYRRIQLIIKQFLKSRLIKPEEKLQFKNIILSSAKIRSSTIVKLVLIVMVYTIGHFISMQNLSLSMDAWYNATNVGGWRFTPAGYWYLYISLPVFQFILLLWYFHVAIWYRLLWKVSRLQLQLNSLHPDQAGGLGFLAESLYVFGPLLVAHSILLAGIILDRIWNNGLTLANFELQIITILAFIILIAIIPSFFFMMQMVREKRLGTFRYSASASYWVYDFKQKWLNQQCKTATNLLETSDVQSLADLHNSFEVSNKMKILPFSKQSLFILISLTLLPLLPLLFTIIPLEKMLKQLFALIF